MCSLDAHPYRYGIHGGSTSAKAARYARKEEELSIKVQYSSKPCEDDSSKHEKRIS